MSRDVEIFNDLFAFRLHYLDYINNEYIIISKLRNWLINIGIDENNINQFLFNFYNYYDIPITMNEIENVLYDEPDIFNDSPIEMNENMLIYSFSDEPEPEPEMVNTIIYLEQDIPLDNLLDNLLDIPLDNQLDNILDIVFNNMEDVVVTTDINSLNNIPILKIIPSANNKSNEVLICSICQEEMNIDDEYFDIECKHIFHKTCLQTYLQNYNHICPTCRNEIGQPCYASN